ncbi:Autophagy-related protein 17 [Phytophthora cactorum]|nr:Autophagy-related protein 17 [Phytophthora cactorum]
MVGGEQARHCSTLSTPRRVEELLAAHQHAITRIAAIYEFFIMFDKAHGSDVDALVGEHRQVASITDEEAKPVQELYDAAVSFFVDMEQCDRFLLQYFTTINDIYPHYEGIFADVQLLFDELRSLRDFYLQFLASYQSVGTEMLRRKQHDTKVLREEEIALRRTFCEEHARFLPSTLCPEIQNLPDRYTVVRGDCAAREEAQ